MNEFRAEHAVHSEVQSTIGTLFDECGTLAYSLAYRLLGGDRRQAEDAVESVFVELSGSLSDGGKEDSIDLRQLTLNRVRKRCLDLLRGPVRSTSDPRHDGGASAKAFDR